MQYDGDLQSARDRLLKIATGVKPLTGICFILQEMLVLHINTTQQHF